jgi:hypothetical protein
MQNDLKNNTELNRNNSPRGYASVFRLAVILLFFGTVFCGSLHAGDDYAAKTTKPPAGPERRFLFIFDTSQPMRARLKTTLHELDNILITATNNQFLNGDTFGVWTFNKEAYSGFPLQSWDSTDAQNLSGMMQQFLQKQKFEGESHLETVMTNLFGLVKNSEYLVTTVFYSGAGKFKGTPFDVEINNYIDSQKKNAAKKNLPIIVILESVRGVIVNFRTNSVPWPIPPPSVVQSYVAARSNSVPEVVKIPVAPLIVQGPKVKNPSPIEVQTPVPVSAPAIPEIVHQVTNVVVTNLVPVPVETPATGTPAPVSPVVTNIKPDTSRQVEKPSPLPVPVSAPVPASVPAAPEATQNNIQAVATPAEAALPAPNTSLSKWIFLGGIVLTVVAIGLVVLIWSRSRNASGPSYITRSMDDRKK